VSVFFYAFLPSRRYKMSQIKGKKPTMRIHNNLCIAHILEPIIWKIAQINMIKWMIQNIPAKGLAKISII
jgi:hypothetical protein